MASRDAWRKHGLFLLSRSFITIGSMIGLCAQPSWAQPVEKKLFLERDAYVAGAFAIGTLALFPVDRRVAQQLQDSSTQANDFLGQAATGFERLTSPGTYSIGGGLYLIGRVGGMRRLADLGLHGTRPWCWPRAWGLC